jgi:hypothetical protein
VSWTTFTVVFKKGEGGLDFAGEGIPEDDSYVSSANGAEQAFQAEQSPGFKIMTITGRAPSGGTIEVEVSDENGNVLSSFEQNKYPEGPFMGTISYTIPE